MNVDRMLLTASCLALACLTGCGGEAASTTGTGSAQSVKSGAPSGSVAKSSAPATSNSAAPATKPASGHSWNINEASRGGASCVFSKWGEDNGKKRAYFKITTPPGKEVDNMQTWQFYYDKDGKLLDRYPHSTFPDKSGEQALGQSGDSLKKDIDVVECEISRITFKDKTKWFNANLVPNTPDRPKGGYPQADLDKQTGEKVTVEVLDAAKGRVKLKNVSDKPTKKVEVNLLYFKADGTHDYKTGYNIDAPLKPGETVEKDIPLGDKGAPADFKTADATAPTVEFDDGTKWSNRNLSGFEIP